MDQLIRAQRFERFHSVYPAETLMAAWQRRAWLGAMLVALLWSGCDRADRPEVVAPAPDSTAVSSATATAVSAEEGDGLASIVRPTGAADGTVTFTRDVAPLVFQACAPCHRLNGAAPFPLISYDDVQSHAQQIVEVTQRRYMPPWLPSPNRHRLRGDRRLSDADIQLLQDWFAQGTPQGDPSLLPPAPNWPDGWPLGPPDLVLTMPEPYLRKASNQDLWRNFAIPIPLDKTRHVQLIDFLPGNAPAIHHAVIAVDATQNSRIEDDRDPGPGYNAVKDGVLGLGPASGGSGQFIGWLPGKIPDRDDYDQIFEVTPGSYLILQLHMPPAGKDESIQSSVGLYFTDRSPQHLTDSIYLSDREIDIPANEQNYLVEQSYQFPIDVDVVRAFPHAHYLCKEMHVYIKLPGSDEEEMLTIGNWNFDWQDDYRFDTPVHLPQGTQIRIRYRYDNTADNVRNPHQPPQRVVYGERSADEMGDLLLCFRVRNDADQQRFRADYLRYQFGLSLKRHQKALARDPNNPHEHVRVGEAFLLLGQSEEARSHFDQSIRIDPDYAVGHARVAMMLEREKKWDRAARELIEAIRLEPDNPDHRKQIAKVLFQLGQHDHIIPQLEAYVRLRPDDGDVLAQLGGLLGRAGKMEESLQHLQRAVAVAPQLASAQLNLGVTLRKLGRHQEALRHLQEAVKLDPKNKGAQSVLQEALRGAQR